MSLAAMSAGPSKADPASCPSPIPLGLTTALTGNVALLGTQARSGVEFAVDEINAAGGINGKKLTLTTEDTGASSTDALNAMNRILEGKPLVIFGSMISPHVFAQTEVVTKSETPFLVGATNAKITAQGSKWLFRTHVHDGQLADLIPAYLVKTLNKTKPGIIAVADDYGLGASEGIQASLAKLNVAPVAVTSYAPSDKDMSAQLLEIKDKGADSVIVFGRPADVTLVDEADERSRHQADHDRQFQPGRANRTQQSHGGGSRRRLCDRRHDSADVDAIQKFWIGRSGCRTSTRCRPTISRSPITTPSIC